MYNSFYNNISEEELQLGRLEYLNVIRPINVNAAINNIKDAKRILEEYNITFFLIFGTLLGAYRDNKIIEHDTDIDLAMLSSEAYKFDKVLKNKAFQNNGFMVWRIEKFDFGLLFSIVRNRSYIDLHFFDRNNDYVSMGHTPTDPRMWNIKLEQVSKLEKIRFLDDTYNIISNPILFFEEKYGADWNKPIVGKHAELR